MLLESLALNTKLSSLTTTVGQIQRTPVQLENRDEEERSKEEMGK
jgi:hypothetical protein